MHLYNIQYAKSAIAQRYQPYNIQREVFTFNNLVPNCWFFKYLRNIEA